MSSFSKHNVVAASNHNAWECRKCKLYFSRYDCDEALTECPGAHLSPKTLTVNDLDEEAILAVVKEKERRNEWYRWMMFHSRHGVLRELIHTLMGHTIIEDDGGPVGLYTSGCSCGVEW